MSEAASYRVKINRNGPYSVTGPLPLARQTIQADADGNSRDWQQGEAFEVTGAYALCRCGHSANKPFCDGTHARIGFDGTETASRGSYIDQAVVYEGPELDLTDAESLCAFARFCDVDGSVWQLVGEAGTTARDQTAFEATHCPGGRLVGWDKQRNPLEPQLDASIGLVEDPQQHVSGPIWLRGGIALESADGTPYEVRNRVTLCRCGASSNKPFCDGTHASVGFDDTK